MTQNPTRSNLQLKRCALCGAEALLWSENTYDGSVSADYNCDCVGTREYAAAYARDYYIRQNYLRFVRALDAKDRRYFSKVVEPTAGNQAALQAAAEFQPPKFVYLWGDAGIGKCLAKGTPILMFDGSILPVEDVRVGDKVMGPDSQPRTVLSLARGREQMYRVTPTKGDSYVVNESHVLSLVVRGRVPGHRAGDVINVSVRDYLSANPTFRANMLGWRAPVDFPAKPVLIDPYFLGLWLGDGDSDRACITTEDAEIVDFLQEFADREGYIVRRYPYPDASRDNRYAIVREHGQGSPLRSAMQSYGLLGNKHIPIEYRANSRHVRLQVMAGLIDADGDSASKQQTVVLKSKVLANDLAYLARSLGFAAYIYPRFKRATNAPGHAGGTYYSVSISGDFSEVPFKLARRRHGPRQQKKNVLRTGIKVEPVGIDNYYGFAVDGDHLFMLGDFTVTHNSHIAVMAARSVILAGKSVRFVSESALLDERAAAKFREGTMSDLPKALILDDIAKRGKPGDTYAALMHDLLEQCDRQDIGVFITSNHSPREAAERIALDEKNGEAIRSRLELGRVIHMTDASRRAGSKA